jgi:8-oxo-dGTP pyrophosphatase MutT (NUDIX family)
LCRELREELGVDVITVGKELFAARDPGSQFEIAFIQVDISGEPQCLEHSALAWLEVARLRELPLAPSDRRFVESISE